MCNYTVKIWHETKKNQFLAISIILAINFSIWVHLMLFALLPGIRGLDESYLPRWIGYGFGSLLLLNHFLGSDAAAVTPAQFVREIKAENCIFQFSIGRVYLIFWGVVQNCCFPLLCRAQRFSVCL